jgi:CspA family cold shock protein
MNRQFGEIKHMVSSKGFGFIEPDGLTGDVFFHMSDCRAFKSLRQGQRVSFIIASSPKGPRASDVSVAG